MAVDLNLHETEGYSMEQWLIFFANGNSNNAEDNLLDNNMGYKIIITETRTEIKLELIYSILHMNKITITL